LFARDALRHFPNEPFRDLAISRCFFGIVGDQQIEDRRIRDLLGQLVRACEFAAVTVIVLEPFKMLSLRRVGGVGRRVVRLPLRARRRLRDHQRLRMVEREPRLPLRIGKAEAVLERFA
jgi:hypothetical protein